MELSNLEKLMESIENDSPIVINDIRFNTYKVERNEDMRLDKISYKLYRNTKYVTELAYINGITDIFGIKEGDVLIIPDADHIELVFNFSNLVLDKLVEEIKKVNEKKVRRKDENRKNDVRNRAKIEEDKKLPPTIKNNDKMIIKDGKLIIKPNF